MWSIRVRLAVTVLALLVVPAAPASADKCTGAKLKAIGKEESGLLTCYAKVVVKGDPSLLAACIQKAQTKYGGAFAKAGSCGGDQTVCECLADECAGNVRGDLPDAGPDKCEAARLKAAGKKASGKLACNAKAALKDVPVDPVCIGKAEAKYQKAFDKTIA